MTIPPISTIPPPYTPSSSSSSSSLSTPNTNPTITTTTTPITTTTTNHTLLTTPGIGMPKHDQQQQRDSPAGGSSPDLRRIAMHHVAGSGAGIGGAGAGAATGRAGVVPAPGGYVSSDDDGKGGGAMAPIGRTGIVIPAGAGGVQEEYSLATSVNGTNSTPYTSSYPSPAYNGSTRTSSSSPSHPTHERNHSSAHQSHHPTQPAAAAGPSRPSHHHHASTSDDNVPRSGRAGVKRRQKYQRTRTGCLSCRARRIKCDEEHPVCRRCTIAKKTCHYPDEESAEGGSRRGSKDGLGHGSRSSSSDSTRSVDEVKVERGKGKVKAEVDDTSALLDDASNLLDPFKQGAQMYESTGGIVQPGDVNWDSSFIGNYDPVEMPFPGPETAEMAVTAVIDVAENTSKSMNAATGIARWGAMGSGPMLATPNFLLPWFPTAEERSLILHYCANAADLMMAIPSGLNPMLAINLPLALDSPRGMNPSADALRVTLLGIGAVHQAFLLARSGMSTPQTAAMFQYASNLRDTAKEMVRRAVLEGGGAKSDAALGAGTALATIDIFFGGGGWLENFSLAKDMVAFRGGPAEMLKASQPTQLAEGVTVSPARLMLEILTIYETFGCLTTGQEPTLISDKWEDWWFEGSRSTYEEHSVEKQFGMSRVMVHLFSRLARLLSRVSRCSTIITESDSPTDNMMLSSVVPMNTGVIDPLLPISSLISSMINPTNSSATDAALIAEARLLNSDVDAWIESLQLSTLEHERVQIGNRAYAYAMKILLLRRVFKYPRQDLRVQNAATRVLEHCSTSTALLGMSIDLTWPAIIAGCCVEPASRPMVLVLLELFKRQCCFDIETACTIIQEVWRRIDVGEPRADWKEVCDDLNLQVLLC